MKQRTLIIIAISFLVVVAGIGWLVTRPQQPTPPTVEKVRRGDEAFRQQYSGVAEDYRFQPVTPERARELFERGDGLIFLGFKECPWCQKLAPIVDEAAKAEGLAAIYYLDIRTARQEQNELYQAIVEKLKPHLRKDEQGNPRVYVPDVSALRGGDIVGHFLQETTADGEAATPDSYWTEERRKRAIDQLRHMIRQTKQFAAVTDDLARGAQLIDVRTPGEFQDGHVQQAVNWPLGRLQAGAMPNVDKNTTLYVYCRSGNRSAEAKRLLEAAGFTRVKDLGGIADVERMGARLTTAR